MQIDFDSSKFAQTGNWRDPQENIKEGCKVLAQKLKFLKQKKSGLQGLELLRTALAAYNAGEGNVLKAVNAGADVDSVTANKNYSEDTLNRAGRLQSKGFA